ncbi:TRAP transporter small permease [Desulfosoma caldarium]|uniref:TRAP-type C4-dicarboxylate transport system permease small subunit n=1 Tax=Desulfosoma caldarium TaxID=610254 RepID=A0A3N1UFQ3_9BACT|nr:TRAP transporter small permease subunit [Desulfosoma caldarium]ROQ90152.1 TRAP-type C4-dicarboxylate transport system permease small subunit [Desulfosoma caldarium]
MPRAWILWLRDHFEEAVCALLLLVMALVAFVNVGIRYGTNYSFAFVEEVEVSALVYLTVFGGAAAFRKGLHLGLHFVFVRLPLSLRRAVLLLSMSLIVFVFGTLAYYGIVQMRDEMALSTLSEALQVPQWAYTLAVPLGSLLIILRAFERTRVLWHEHE